MRGMCSAVLAFEAVMMLLSILVLNGFSSLSMAAATAIGCGMAAACVIGIGGLGRGWGYTLGHAVQVGIVVVGFFAMPILFIGILFAGLWVAACVIGLRIERDRAIR
jgi:hypothetical protein